MSHGPVLDAEDQSASGFNRRVRLSNLYGCFLGVQSNQNVSRRRGEDSLHHRCWAVLLSGHALRPEKCWGNISEDGEQDLRPANWEEHVGLHG